MDTPNDVADLSDEQIGDRSGMGNPANAEMHFENGEEPEDTEEVPEKTEEKPAEEEDESPDDSEEESEDEEEESEKSENKKRTVPYSKLKSEREARKSAEADLATERAERTSLREAITALTRAIATKNSDDSGKEEEPDDIEAAAEEILKDLGDEGGNLDAKALAAVLRKSVELAEKKLDGKIPKELKDKVKLLDKVEEDQAAAAEAAHFSSEWKGFIPDLQKAYPNASEAMLTEAKEHMDKLAHSKEFHQTPDLAYIHFKNKKAFDTILMAAAKPKSGEAGRKLAQDRDDAPADNDEEVVDIESMTPEIMKQREEKSMISRESNKRKDYRITKPIRG